MGQVYITIAYTRAAYSAAENPPCLPQLNLDTAENKFLTQLNLRALGCACNTEKFCIGEPLVADKWRHDRRNSSDFTGIGKIPQH